MVRLKKVLVEAAAERLLLKAAVVLEKVVLKVAAERLQESVQTIPGARHSYALCVLLVL